MITVETGTSVTGQNFTTEHTWLHTCNFRPITPAPSISSFTHNALFYCTRGRILNIVLPFIDGFWGFGPGAFQYCCSCPSSTVLFPSSFMLISTSGDRDAKSGMWQELLAGLSRWIGTLQFPSLSMTEVPVPSTDEGGEQRGRTRRNLHLRLVLRIIQNLRWLSAKQKMQGEEQVTDKNRELF